MPSGVSTRTANRNHKVGVAMAPRKVHSRSVDLTRTCVPPVALASIPEQIRGYGHVKEAHLATAKKREAELLAAFRAPPDARKAAE